MAERKPRLRPQASRKLSLLRREIPKRHHTMLLSIVICTNLSNVVVGLVDGGNDGRCDQKQRSELLVPSAHMVVPALTTVFVGVSLCGSPCRGQGCFVVLPGLFRPVHRPHNEHATNTRQRRIGEKTQLCSMLRLMEPHRFPPAASWCEAEHQLRYFGAH